MQEGPFEAYMLSRNLADKTRAQRTYALKRIERAHGIDPDAEFERDRLAGVLARLAYSVADERAKLPIHRGLISRLTSCSHTCDGIAVMLLTTYVSGGCPVLC